MDADSLVKGKLVPAFYGDEQWMHKQLDTWVAEHVTRWWTLGPDEVVRDVVGLVAKLLGSAHLEIDRNALCLLGQGHLKAVGMSMTHAQRAVFADVLKSVRSLFASVQTRVSKDRQSVVVTAVNFSLDAELNKCVQSLMPQYAVYAIQAASKSTEVLWARSMETAHLVFMFRERLHVALVAKGYAALAAHVPKTYPQADAAYQHFFQFSKTVVDQYADRHRIDEDTLPPSPVARKLSMPVGLDTA